MTATEIESDFLTKRDIAQRLQCSEKNLDHLERAGLIPPSVKFQRLRRWRRSDWEKFASAQAGEVK